MNINTRESIGKFVAEQPWALDILLRHKVDFCCGGHRTFDEACEASGVDPAPLLADLSQGQDQKESKREGAADWATQPLINLIEHIVERFHQPLPATLDRFVMLSSKVLGAHGDGDKERLGELAAVIVKLREELVAHMAREEDVLFPWVISGNGQTAGDPIHLLQQEHEAAAAMLSRIRKLTDEFTAPAYACTTVKLLWDELRQFDRELREHVHLENNILFPRALAENGGES